ncbi:MAG: AsmA family protein [Rhodanobacter sp.]
MRRSHKILAWIIGLLLALSVALIVIVALFNWNRLKPTINDKVSQAIGRPFAINGDLSAAWQREPAEGGLRALVPWPTFTARDISITNPGWAKQPTFTHLDALRFRLSPLGLLVHHINVPMVQLVQPSIDLERNKQGQATWDFTLPQSSEPSAWTLNLGAIGFDSGQIALDDVKSNVKLQITITPLKQAIPYDQIVAQASSDARAQVGSSVGSAARKSLTNEKNSDKSSADTSGTGASSSAASATAYQFEWNAAGSYQGAALEGSGRIGAVLALQQTSQPFPVQAKLRVGDSHIALVGTLTDPMHLAALDLKLWFAGSSMAKLYPIIGITLPDTPPYATEGHLTAELHRHSSHFSYQNFHGSVGGSDLSGSLTFVTDGDRPKLTGDLHSQVLRFVDLAPLIGADSNAQKEQRGDTHLQPTDKVLPTDPFRTDRWKAMDADVTFSGAHIAHGDSLPIESLSTHLVMNDGALRLDPLQFGLANGTVNGSIHLDGSRASMQGALQLHARHLKLKQLFPTFEPMRTSFGEINGDTALQAQGNSVAALLGSSNGEIKLLMTDGAISKTLLETAGLNVGNIVIGKLFGDKTVKIHCAATDLTAQSGLFDARLFVFDTQDALINVTGTVNFANENLNLNVIPHTKGMRIFSLRSPLYVQGTLKQPKVGVQMGPLLLRGGGALALGVLAAPVAALLPLVALSHDTGDTNTCNTVLAQMSTPAKVTPAAKTASKPSQGSH